MRVRATRAREEKISENFSAHFASRFPIDCMDRGPRLVCELHPFERDWHDWIVKKEGQLAAFTRYIRENPYRATMPDSAEWADMVHEAGRIGLGGAGQAI